MRLGSRWGRVCGGPYTDWLKGFKTGAGFLLLFGRGGGGYSVEVFTTFAGPEIAAAIQVSGEAKPIPSQRAP